MYLSPEAVENAAQNVLKQLSERLNFSRQQRCDEEMECLHFGICTVPVRSYS